MILPPPRRAGSSARRRPLLRRGEDGASARRGSPRVSCATAWVNSEHGSWSGTVWSSVSSSQRILSLWLDRLSTDRIARQWRETTRAPTPLPLVGRGWGWGSSETHRRCPTHHPPPRPSPTRGEGEEPPLVVFGKRGNLDLLVAVDATAERLGLRAGLALAQARAMHPALTAVPEDAAADARLLDAIADWCQRYTPLVAVAPPDGILFDIGGCAHLFGGEEKLRDDLLARMWGWDFSARAAIAATIGAACAAVRFADAAITATGDERALIAPLPLAALRLPDETVAALKRVGLKRIGDILDLPRA